MAWYVENESGAKLARPELFRLLADAHAGDILLVEQVDRLSRLTGSIRHQAHPRCRSGSADIVDDGRQVQRRVHRRPHRQAQGQAKAKAEGLYKGRAEDVERNAGIAQMIAAKQSWSSIQAATGCSRATIAKIAKRAKQAA